MICTGSFSFSPMDIMQSAYFLTPHPKNFKIAGDKNIMITTATRNVTTNLISLSLDCLINSSTLISDRTVFSFCNSSSQFFLISVSKKKKMAALCFALSCRHLPFKRPSCQWIFCYVLFKNLRCISYNLCTGALPVILIGTRFRDRTITMDTKP